MNTTHHDQSLLDNEQRQRPKKVWKAPKLHKMTIQDTESGFKASNPEGGIYRPS